MKCDQLRQVHKLLCMAYPVFKKRKPLSLSIRQQLRLAEPEMPESILTALLDLHVGGIDYHRNMLSMHYRYNLDDTEAEPIKLGHRGYSAKRLRKRAQRKQPQRRQAAG